jgi:hypothetical protein
MEFQNCDPLVGIASWGENIIIPQVLSFGKVHLKTFYILVKLPNPLQHDGNVHVYGVTDPQSPKLLWFANRCPVNNVVLLLLIHPFPKEVRLNIVKNGMKRLMANIGKEDKHKLVSSNLLPNTRKSPCHGLTLHPALTTKKSQSKACKVMSQTRSPK